MGIVRGRDGSKEAPRGEKIATFAFIYSLVAGFQFQPVFQPRIIAQNNKNMHTSLFLREKHRQNIFTHGSKA